ncbi:type VI secretion system tip protein TssI/VgrG [Vibrio tubiashii]|uniref:type VI secretion system tip protein TssI/VgrG n=1 Tax=Vibrio tubiashii TaxID=29498 RepID=UPI00234F440C|nr:type VI secretion system tip protein TssI/VgrG [Vibrio tubiashii]WCP65879.1 type VI secretion system tip protein TssI/VgrG [Vibrio tubiashii]
MPTLNYLIEIDGLEDESLVVHEFNGCESLSSDDQELCIGYRYEINLASRRHDLSEDDIVDKNVQLKFFRNGVLERILHGVVREFTAGDTGHHHTFYSLTLVPSLERLSLRHNSRIFQHQTCPEIVSILLQEMGINDYSFSLKNQYQQREFCVQYRETDLAFINRLLAEEGIIYSFYHEQGKHTVVFSDTNESLLKLETALPYNALAGGANDEPCISSLLETKRVEVSRVELSDYSFKKPSYRLVQKKLGVEQEYQNTEHYEYFDSPGRYKEDVVGELISQTRMDYLRRNAHFATAKSNAIALQAGLCFSIEEHIDDEITKDWQVISIKIRGTQPQALEEEGGNGATTYHNELVLVPAKCTWQSKPQNKPTVDGSSIATVVGPKGEEIYCDEHGRVKLHFPWDRYSSGDEHSSCWVRVSQGWAGSQYGMMALPRVGQEVIVSFLNGDPDQPIVTGRSYNANNTLPYSLPENKTKTVIRSESYQGSGFNELSFEDQVDKEQIYLHAQKDFNAEVKNDSTTHIRHDQHSIVENNRFKQVLGSAHSTIEGESRTQIKGTTSEVVESSSQQQIGTLFSADAGREITLKSGAKIVVEAGAEITLKAGGSFVKVDGGGVHLVGPAINLNGGGSAGRGSDYAGQLAELPKDVESPQAPEVSKAVSYQALLKAEEANVPAVKPCPLAGDA